MSDYNFEARLGTILDIKSWCLTLIQDFVMTKTDPTQLVNHDNIKFGTNDDDKVAERLWFKTS